MADAVVGRMVVDGVGVAVDAWAVGNKEKDSEEEGN